MLYSDTGKPVGHMASALCAGIACIAPVGSIVKPEARLRRGYAFSFQLWQRYQFPAIRQPAEKSVEPERPPAALYAIPAGAERFGHVFLFVGHAELYA